MNYLESRDPVIYIRWIYKKYGNFTYGKVYEATPAAVRKDGTHTRFRIADDDGDYYSLHREEIGRLFVVIGGVLDDCH